MNNVIFVADMDGTLTPARLPMTTEFAAFFEKFIKDHTFFIVSGSDYKKICEQMSTRLAENVARVYTSMGNELYEHGKLVYRSEFKPDESLIALLESYRKNTTYDKELYPNYLEMRQGMLNFSVLGRDCPHEARIAYKAWDDVHHEREKIRQELEKLYPQYDITVGGNISIDIVANGCGKEQVAPQLRAQFPDAEIVFLGDRTMPGGNDHSLAEALRKMDNTQVVQVEGPDDSLNFLKKYCN